MWFERAIELEITPSGSREPFETSKFSEISGFDPSCFSDVSSPISFSGSNGSNVEQVVVFCDGYTCSDSTSAPGG